MRLLQKCQQFGLWDLMMELFAQVGAAVALKVGTLYGER